MITDFQKKKLSYFFKILDLNSNGELQLNDFAEMAEKVRQKMGYEEGGKRHKGVADKAVRFYRTLLQDIQPDDFRKIREKEWISFFERKIFKDDNEVAFDLYKELIFNFMFDFFDQNRDGFISIKEYEDFYDIFGIDEDYLDKAFFLMDKSKKKKLSRYDLMNAMDEFLRSDDPESAGNWVFGYWGSDPHTEDLF